MHYNKMDTSLVDTKMFIEGGDTSPSSLQQNRIATKKIIRNYRLATSVSLILFLICSIALLVTVLHKKQYPHTNNSVELLQSSACNYRNSTSLNSSLISGGCEHFTRVENWDYPGYDMLQTTVKNYEACCSMCWHQASCMGFAYSPFHKACWIKTTMTEDSGHSHSDRISGILGACTKEESINNWDYPGNNLFKNEMNGSIPVADWRTCCGLCIRQTFCRAYTFSSTTHECWLKTKVGDGTFDSSRISGYKD